jgi:hypothetical protein
MIRPLFVEVALFLTPFAVYAIYLWATRAKIIDLESWPPRTLAGLAVASLVLMIVSFVLIAEFSGAPTTATYVPAHIENGRLVPGIEK